MEEIWKDIKGYEGLYQVSNLGNVRSFPRKGTHSKEITILKYEFNHKGYKQVGLTKKCKVHTKRIHRLVAETFISNPENKLQVNHINGDKTDNRVENLEWCTNEYNMAHSWKIGLRSIEKTYKRGKEHCRSVTVNQYDLYGNFIKKWDCVRDIERILGFDNRNICACCRHKRNVAYGYVWRYENDNDISYNPKTRNKYSY